MSVRCLNAGQHVTVMYHFLWLSENHIKLDCDMMSAVILPSCGYIAIQ